MKVSPILWAYHKTKDRKFPVKIRVTSTIDKKTSTSYVQLGFSIEKSQWTGSRVRNHPNAQEYNFKIINSLSEIEKNYTINGSPVLGDKADFYWWLDKYMEQIKHSCGRNHIRKISSFYNRIKEYCPSLLVRQITPEFISKYESDLLAEGLHRNYVTEYLRRLRGILTLAIGPNNSFNGIKLKTIKTVKNRLNLDQVLILEKLKLNKIESLPRDMWVFSFYSGGMRFGDLCRLKKENIRGTRLQYTMNKGIKGSDPSRINIELRPQALAIFKKYKYQFPTSVNWKRPDDSINNRNSTMNETLRRVCRENGLPEVTFHCARHSIADLSVQRKLTPAQMMGVLGHKKISTTQIYMKEFYSEQTDEAMEKLFS